MIVFIDESGVHKAIDHATVAVVYLAVEDYPTFERAILEIERSLGIVTFHWAETAWPVKAKFLDAVLRLDFQAKVAICKNPLLEARRFETVLRHLLVEPHIRAIYLDGKKSRRYERSVKKVLRDQGVSVKKVRTVSDESSAGIRVADMVAGLARTVADGKQLVRMEPYFKRLRKKLILTLEL